MPGCSLWLLALAGAPALASPLPDQSLFDHEVPNHAYALHAPHKPWWFYNPGIEPVSHIYINDIPKSCARFTFYVGTQKCFAKKYPQKSASNLTVCLKQNTIKSELIEFITEDEEKREEYRVKILESIETCVDDMSADMPIWWGDN